MKYSWWTGRIDLSRGNATSPSVALVVGITDIVGGCLAKYLTNEGMPGGPWMVYGVSMHPPSNFLEKDTESIAYIQCDLHNRDEVSRALHLLHDVTHLFWVQQLIPIDAGQTGDIEQTELQYSHMFRNVVETMLKVAPNLQHISLQTGYIHYLCPFSSGYRYRGHVKSHHDPRICLSTSGYFPASQSHHHHHHHHHHEPPYREGNPRPYSRNVCYKYEDILFEAVRSSKGQITWSIHRPSILMGFAPGSTMNVISSLAVYAVICKHKGQAFKFPGSKAAWERFMDMCDAHLEAEQLVWASCLQPDMRNKAFNVSNGDLITFKRIWRLMAGEFGLDVPALSADDEVFSLKHMMEVTLDVEFLWKEIVDQYKLLPCEVHDLANWEYLDTIIHALSSPVLSLNKCKDHGFTSFRSTEKSLLHSLHELRTNKFIPIFDNDIE